MAITVSGIISRSRTLLNDTAGTRWTDAEMLTWVNDGRREMASLRPSVFSQTAAVSVQLIAGNRQEVTTPNAFAITEITHNINSDLSMGKSIRETTRASFSDFKPDWQSDKGSYVQNWFRDTLNPLAFWVYPQVTGGLIALQVLVTPTDLTDVNQTALPFDQYIVPLTNYVLYRAYSKDAEVAQNAQLAASYLQLFTTALAGKE